MKTSVLFFAFLVNLFTLLHAPHYLYSQYVVIDTDFGNDGTYTIQESLNGLEVQKDKKILFLTFDEGHYILKRLTEDGTPDQGFGTEGVVHLQAGYKRFHLQPDGKILLTSGHINKDDFPTGSPILIMRLKEDGSPDEDFDVGSFDFALPYEYDEKVYRWNEFKRLTFQPDGKILVSARSSTGMDSDNEEIFSEVLFRLNYDGSIDTGFGEAGSVHLPLDLLDDEIHYFYDLVDVKVLSNGKIVALGNYYNEASEGTHIFMLKFQENGDLDPGTNGGILLLQGRGHYESGFSLNLQSDDKIVVYANHRDEEDLLGFNTRQQLIRLYPDGQPDHSFADQGILSNLPFGHLLQFSNDDMLLIYEDEPWIDEDIMKIAADGKETAEFNASPLNRMDLFYFVLQDDQRLLVAGIDYVDSGGNTVEISEITRYILNLNPEEKSLVKHFTLINADSDDEVYQLEDGKIINLFEIDAKNINIRAFTSPEVTGSVKFVLTGARNYSHIENLEPYALFKNQGSDFFGWRPKSGSYQLTAIPYSEPNGKGEMGSPLTINFTIIDVEVARVQKFTLINAETDTEVSDLDFVHGLTIYLDEIGTSQLNIRAYTDPKITGSVAFELYRQTDRYYLEHQTIENIEPYAVFGNLGNDYFNWNAEPGVYHLKARAYSKKNAKGVAGVPEELWFTILPHPMEETGRMLGAYPNPGQNFVTISLDGFDVQKIDVAIFDMVGNQVTEIKGHQMVNNIATIDVSTLDKKNYIIKINTGKSIKTFRWYKK